MKTRETNGKPKDFARLFELFGVDLQRNGSADAHADECPFCGKGKFYVNSETGAFKCHSANTCGRQGNAYTFINWVHGVCLNETTDTDYRLLKDRRGLPLQTLKEHGLAWNGANNCWLIPYKSAKGSVQNMTRYYLESGDKLALPVLPLRLFGLNALKIDSSRVLFVCEGPFDAIALDHHLTSKKTRKRYDVIAVPGATIFNPEWVKHLKGRTVRLCFDNDKAGRDGQERIAKLIRDSKVDCKLHALNWPTGYPDKCDISDLVRDGENIVEFTRAHCVNFAGEKKLIFVRGDQTKAERKEWLDDGHIPFGQFVSLSGPQGSHKSDISRDYAARATAGLPMPGSGCKHDPFNVMYFASEDSQATVSALIKLAGGNTERVFIFDSSNYEALNLIDHLQELEAEIKRKEVKLVIFDALNSFTKGDQSSDANARCTLSGPLGLLARRTGACVIGVRNQGRAQLGKASDKALGAISLSHVSRCDMYTVALPPIDPKDKTEPRRFQVEFEKVTDSKPPQPIRFDVVDCSHGPEDSHLRRIVWKESVDSDRLKTALRKKVAKKGSKVAQPTLSGRRRTHT